jgi:DNA-binding transcriptional regulator YiaG
VNRDSGTDLSRHSAATAESANGGWARCWVLHSGQSMSFTTILEADLAPRKLIPVNPKTMGDHLLLKRIEANLSQPEMAVKLKVSVQKVKAWEHDQMVPIADEWRDLTTILRLDLAFPKS